MTGEQQLVDRFNRRMVDLYESAKQAAPFLSVRNLPVLSAEEGLPVAQAILAAANTSPAFAELTVANCETLTVEYLVLQHPYSQLFTLAELEVARRRLGVPTPEEPQGITADDLAARFERRMAAMYDRAKWDLHYDARHFLRLVETRGGVQAAQDILADPSLAGGLAELAIAGRPDLNVEALVLEPSFASLFSAAELEVARERLTAMSGGG
jgi:hypothetical protein